MKKLKQERERERENPLMYHTRSSAFPEWLSVQELERPDKQHQAEGSTRKQALSTNFHRAVILGAKEVENPCIWIVAHLTPQSGPQDPSYLSQL
jgi:hypothetical protein